MHGRNPFMAEGVELRGQKHNNRVEIGYRILGMGMG